MGAARLLVFAVLIVAAGAHPGHAATEQLTRFFAFGPGTNNPLGTSDSVGLVVESRTVVHARVTFDSGCCTNVTVTLKAKGVQVVQGTQLPVQEVLLPAQVFFRN